MRNLLLALGMILYPLAVHALVLLEAPVIAVVALVVMSLAYLVMLGAKKGEGMSPIWFLIYGLLALIGIISLQVRTVHALFLPPVLINLGLLAVFGATLRRGAVPMVERLLRIAYRDKLPPGLAQLARRLTWLWVFFFIAMLVLAVGLALFAPLAVWSLFVNVLYYFLVVAMLLGQHHYRHVRFRRYGSVSLWRLARDLARISPRDPAHPIFGNGGRP